MPGFNFVKVRISGKGKYDQNNKPYIDFNHVVAGTEKQRRFIADDRAVANIIIGDPTKQRPAPDTDWGHFHLESSEFWFILLGKMEYKIGSLPIFIADQGDIVYTPRETWHRARFARHRNGLPAGDERVSGSAAQLPAAGLRAERGSAPRIPYAGDAQDMRLSLLSLDSLMRNIAAGEQ